MKKLSLFASLVALLIITTACAVGNTEELIEKAVSAQEELDSYYGEVQLSFSFENESETSTFKEWQVKPNKSRTESDDGHLFVSNGETCWSYDKAENTVTIFDDVADAAEEMPNESEMIREVLTEMKKSNEVTVKGKETIAGRKTIHLLLTPKADQIEESFLGGNYELWIDEETYMPLKLKVSTDEFATEMEYTHIEYNVNFDDSLFAFDIPEGAKVQTMGDFMPDPLTLEELKEQAPFKIPEFTYIPAGYEFTEATYIEDVGMASLEFATNDQNLIMVSLSTDEVIHDDGDAEAIQIGHYKGFYSHIFDLQFITWFEGDLQIEITSFAKDFSKEELVKIAEGVK